MEQLTVQQALDLALQHQHAGRLAEAEQIYRQILAADPRNVDALHLLGLIAQRVGHFEAAIELIRQSVALKPDQAVALSNLGNAYCQSGRLDEAVAACQAAIAVDPRMPEPRYNLGNAFFGKGEWDEAVQAYRTAIKLRPDYADAHNNLGSALVRKLRMDEAAESFRRASQLDPTNCHAITNLANVLIDTGRPDEAIAEYQKSLATNPNAAGTYSNLGVAYQQSGRLDDAIFAFRRAISLQPAQADAYHNLLLSLHYHSAFDAATIASEHAVWNRQHALPLARNISPHSNDPVPDRRLRIGYISPDFRDHAVARFMLPLLANHDPRSVEVFAYASVGAPDDITDRLRAHTHHWRSIAGMSDQKAAGLIRDDRIDILVDLALHTAGNRLFVFAQKPAPVQITYLAYAGSSGLSTMDYRLSDPYIDPPGGDESVYSEKTYRLPETYWCYAPVSHPPPHPPPSLRNGFTTFGCFNSFFKVNDGVLGAWAKLLETLPDSKLILHAHPGSHRQRLLDSMQQRGIDPGRISFVGRLSIEAYFEQYRQIDIALDTFPFGGGTTSCDALWMGVPLVTLVGERAVGRGGLSILSNIGLPDLAATSSDQYVQIAAALASNLARLSELRVGLRERMQNSPLMDAPRFARNIEAAYRDMWRNWCERQSAHA
jgi:predicted O-linked N-acetylglucosamine transferase (SPINDLY family)